MIFALAAVAFAADDPLMQGCDLTDGKFVEIYNEAVANIGSDLKRARTQADRALKMQPQCAGAALMAIQSRLLLADPSMFLFMGDAERLHPNLSLFPEYRSHGLFLAQDFAGALQAAQLARSVDPESIQAATFEFNALMRLGKYDEVETLISTYPGADAASRDCLRIRMYIDQKKPAGSLRSSCAASSDTAIRELALGDLDLVGGDFAAAGARTHALGVGTAGIDATAAEMLSQGKYAEALPLYEGLVEAEAWNALYRIMLALCQVGLDQSGKARKTLEELYGMDTWITQHQSGAVTGIVTKGAEEQFKQAMQTAFAQLVELQVERGDMEAAATALRKAEARFGRTGVLAAPAIQMQAAADGNAAAWKALSAALVSFPDEPSLLLTAAKMALTDATGLPDAVEAAVAERGSESARYNVLVGLHNARLNPRCAAFGERIVTQISVVDQGKVNGMRYACLLDGNDILGADALLAKEGAKLPVEGRIWHVDKYLAADRVADALSLLDQIVAAGAGEKAQRASDLRISALTQLGRLDEALAEVKPRLSASFVVYNLAVSFARTERFVAAHGLMEGFDCTTLDIDPPEACPQFKADIARLAK